MNKMKHYILVKWNSLLNDKETLIEEIHDLFCQTLTIEGIHRVDVFKNIINRENRYDLMVRIEMDESALERYDQSIAHKKWKECYSKYIESKAIFDSEN